MSKGAASSSDAPCSSDAKAPKRRPPTSASPATEESATKRSKSAGKKTAAVVEQAAENGVILKIVVENFMNHGHMQIDLDPHVNFIVGKNGSGKSAIVAACIAGLGCKAATTGRNLSSYKHFIKHGTDYALVQIHLANGGHDPYCHDEFGDVIVVEHRIEKSGGGTYRLKSADGRVDRKVTKKVVEELNLHYNIQADNPCSLLTQEAAKKFLHNGNEEDRYRFFLGAANLGTQKQDLMSAQVNLVNMQEDTEKAQQRIPEFEEYARAAKAEHLALTLTPALTLALNPNPNPNPNPSPHPHPHPHPHPDQGGVRRREAAQGARADEGADGADGGVGAGGGQGARARAARARRGHGRPGRRPG